MSIQWRDRVYGESLVDDPGIVALIGTPTFQRLKGVRQAGPSALAFPFKNVTRFEHSLGVHLLLRRLGAPRKEQIAGLLHDISHTAFSHAIDFVHASEEQAHHEDLKHLFLERPDLKRAIEELGYSPSDFYDDSVYGLLERPIPWLCADRLDYFLRDGLACRVVDQGQVGRILAATCVADGFIAVDDRGVADGMRDLFAEMNRDWWASPTEAYIYNEFGQILRLAMDRGVVREEDLLGEDDHVLEILRTRGDGDLVARLEGVLKFKPAALKGYDPVIIPKVRWLDPPVRVGERAVPLSELEGVRAGVGG